MITQWQSGETVIGRLRVEGACVDPAIAQLRLSTLLNSAVSHPSALPPSAIVFIRKLSDPLPRSLRIQQRYVRPSQAWQQALNSKIESLVASAVRPALGAVPANTEAVVFLDRSELLASLASDWCEGQMATRWWWQSLLKKASASQIVKELWRNAPEYVPAALDKLARSAKAVQFVKTSSNSEARALLISVVRAFRIDDLVRVLDQVPAKSPFQINDDFPLPQSSKESERDVRSPVKVMQIAPWNHWVRESELSGLEPEQQKLLGIALMLQRAPARVRNGSFTREVEAWSSKRIIAHATPFDRFGADERKVEGRAQTHLLSRAPAAHAEDTSSVPLVPKASSLKAFLDNSVTSARDIENSILAEATPAFTVSHNLTPEHLKEEELTPSEETATPCQPQLPFSSPEQTLTSALVEPKWNNSDNSIITSEPPSTMPHEFPLIELQITTEFGGLFYLINLGIYLGLYGDFTTPAEPGIDLNIWDFVALLGRELLGERIETDPVWKLLERLSGRTEGEEPGSTFQPPDEVRLETINHKDTKAQIDLNPVRAWLDRLMPYVRARLQRALGLSQTEDPARLLCEQHARVYVTPTHVDVFMTLAELPIEIRFAGLDRNCGWLPAAGRFINFHFE